MKGFVSRHPVALFIAITLLIQFTIVLVTHFSIPEGGRMHDVPLAHMIFRFRVFGPLVIVMAITGFIEGRAGVRKLFNSYLHWRVPFKWYVLAASWKFAITWAAMIVIVGFGMAPWPGWFVEGFFWPLMKNMAFLVGIALVEETSWMKFGITRLHQRFDALWSSIIIGTGWGLWYLPMILIGEGVPDGMPWWASITGMWSLAVFLSWAHNMTRSGLVMLLMQIVSNCTFFIVPVLPGWAGGSAIFVFGFVVVFFVASVLLVVKYGRKDLGKGPRARWDDPEEWSEAVEVPVPRTSASTPAGATIGAFRSAGQRP